MSQQKPVLRETTSVRSGMESQRAGFDIGMDRAIREWLHKHYTAWAAAHRPPQTPPPSSEPRTSVRTKASSASPPPGPQFGGPAVRWSPVIPFPLSAFDPRL